MILTMTVCDRPKYLARVLDSLTRLDGVAGCVLLASVEPGCPEVLALLDGFDACAVEVEVNPRRLGVAANTHRALGRGFARSGFVAHLEDDIELAPDTLRLLAWCRDRYRDDADVLAICAYSPHRPSRPCEWANAVVRMPWFSPQVWGTWADRWEELAASWEFDDGLTGAERGWDWQVNRLRGDRRCVWPVLSRSRHIGRQGLHTTEETFAGDLPGWFAADVAAAGSDWFETGEPPP